MALDAETWRLQHHGERRHAWRLRARPVDFATSSLWIYVADCDALFNRAKKAGCTVIMEMMDAFWATGWPAERPFGTPGPSPRQVEYTPEEIDKNMKAWLATMGPRQIDRGTAVMGP